VSNLDTMRAVLKARLHMDSPYIDGAIGDALRFVRNEELWFNVDLHEFETESEIWEYALPEDFLNIRGEVWCTPSSATDNDVRYRLQRRTIEEIEAYRFAGHDLDFGTAGLSVGFPKTCAIDYSGREIVLSPQTEDGGDTIYFRYTKDLGTPRYTATTGSSAPPSMKTVFTLTTAGGEPILGTYTNAWFNEGFHLVVARASQYLWSIYHGGTEESQAKAGAAAQEYVEELRRLWSETSDKQSVTRVRAYL